MIDRLADERRPPDERHVLQTARLSQQAGPAGIFRCLPETLAVQTGYPPAKVVKCLRALEPDWVEYDPPVLWIKNALRYDPNVHLSNARQRVGVERWIAALPRLGVVLNFCEYYGITKPFDGETPSLSIRGHNSWERGVKRSKAELSGVKRSEAELGVVKDGTTTPPVRLTSDAPPADSATWGKPEDLIALYNRLAPPGLARVTRLSPARRSKAQKYLRDFPEREFWTRCFTELKFSRLLLGLAPSPGHENFRGDLDWLLTRGKDGSENAVKTAEGKYRDRGLGVGA